MVYRRKSISKMADAAAAAAYAHHTDRASTGSIAIAAALAVHEAIPDKAPGQAAIAASKAKASGALCTAIAAGVAAAAAGWEPASCRAVSKTALDGFNATTDRDPAVVAERVANGVYGVSSRYPAVEAAAAAAFAAHVPIYGADAAAKLRGATIASAKAAGVAAKAIRGPDKTSYARVAAARAIVSRQDTKKSVVEAVAEAYSDGEDCIAAAIAHAWACADSKTSASLESCGEEWLEAIPPSHGIARKNLETIVALDTFLAGFLLFSLTGKLRTGTGVAASEEVVQIVLQAYSFTVFLAATMSAGMFMLLTGDKRTLTRNDVLVPALLSAFGFLLLLVTVADAVFLELGQGIHYNEHHHYWFWTTVTFGGIFQLFGILAAVFSAGAGNSPICTACPTWRGSKYAYKWQFCCVPLPTVRRVERPKAAYQGSSTTGDSNSNA